MLALRARLVRRVARLSGLVLAGLLCACGGGGSASAGADTGTDAGTGVGTDTGSTPARWRPAVSDTWHWQLTGTVGSTRIAAVHDLDLFDTPQATIDALQAQGVRVVCYFSAGSAENWRSDFAQFSAGDRGNALSGWPGESWLDTRSASVRQVMRNRLAMAAAKGCDGVEPDNVDAYTHSTGFALTAATQLDYNRFLASEAHALGLAVALKNDMAQLQDLVADFDFAINEQCHQFNECGLYAVFTAAGKAVFNAEYNSTWANNASARATLCATARAAQLRTVVLPQALDGSLRHSCDAS